MSARLLVNPGTPQAWEIQLKPGVNRIGRGEQNDFQIPHGSISGTHCEFAVSDAGVTLKDLGSTNGTFVNRSRVTEAALQSGQHIQLGSVDLIYEFANAGQGTAPPPAARAPVRVALSSAPAGAAPAAAPAAAPVRLTVPTAVQPPASPPLPPPVTARPAGLKFSGAQAVAATPAAATSTEDDAAAAGEEAPPLVSAPLSAGVQFCRSHSKTPARFYCPKCQKFFCDLCVGTRAGPGGSVHNCRACGAAVTPVQVNVVRPEASQPGFYASLPGAFGYPFRGFGIMTLLLAAFLFGGEQYLAQIGMLRGPFGFVIRVIMFGFLYLYLQNIIHTTASDEKEPLGFPEAGGFFGAAFQLAMTGLVSFSLAFVLFLVRIFTDIEIPGAAMVAALVLGCLYFPMAVLAVAMKDSILAANPLVVIPTILKIPVEYFVTTILLMAVFGLRWLGSVLAGAATDVTMATRSISVMLGGLAAQAVLALSGVYFLTVCVRVLGILYNRKKQEFGWFSH